MVLFFHQAWSETWLKTWSSERLPNWRDLPKVLKTKGKPERIFDVKHHKSQDKKSFPKAGHPTHDIYPRFVGGTQGTTSGDLHSVEAYKTRAGNP